MKLPANAAIAVKNDIVTCINLCICDIIGSNLEMRRRNVDVL
jgi:hypothetical protein